MITSFLDADREDLVQPRKAPLTWHKTDRLPPLKQLSLVSRSFHRLVRPLLHARFVIPVPPNPDLRTDPKYPVTRLRHGLMESEKALKSYMSRIKVRGHVERFTLNIRPDLVCSQEQLRDPAAHAIDLKALGLLWECIFSILDPIIFRIVAPVNVLAWLMCNVVDVKDAWAFPQTSVQTLELHQLAGSNNKSRTSFDIFDLRRWQSVKLQEGSFLRAYGHYDYHNLMLRQSFVI